VAGLGEKNPRNLLRIHFNGNGIVAGAIKHGRNLARHAYTARGILVELALTGLRYDDFRHSISLFCSGTAFIRSAPFVVASDQ
jgi:hypothetical protein